MNLTPVELVAVGLAGVGTGLIGAVLGTGGGVFLIPLLVLGFGLPVHHAVATSIVTVIATSSAVASANVERGTANMRLGMTLEVATSLGAIAGGLTAAVIAPRALEALFGAVLVPTAAIMWLRSEPPAAAGGAGEPVAVNPGELGGGYFEPSVGGPVAYRVRQLWAGLGISFIAGNLSGLLGIGGGVFKVPALHLLCGVPIKAAAATSNFMIGVTAAASAFLYYGRGEVRPGTTAAAVLGVLAGSAAGAVLSQRLKGGLVRRLFAILLGLVAIQMLYRVAG